MVRLLLLAIMFLVTRVCLACDCVGISTCGGFHERGTFFVGTPVSRRVVNEPNESRFRIAVYSVRITEALSTSTPKSVMVEVRTGIGGGDCGWDFRLGTSYLLETRSSPFGKLWTSLCSGTGEASVSEVLLRQLRSARDGRKQDSLMGSVRQQQLSRDSRTGKVIQRQISPGWDSYPIYVEKPLPSIVVTALHGRDLYAASTDGEGIFSFPDLPSGDYVLTPTLPAGLKLYRGENVGRDYSRVTIPEPTNERPLCRAYLLGQPNGGISGRIVGSPRFLKRVTISAWLIEDQDKIEIESDFPGPDGMFVLGSLPPGHYQVVATTGVGPHKRPQFSREAMVSENGTSQVVLTSKRMAQGQTP